VIQGFIPFYNELLLVYTTCFFQFPFLNVKYEMRVIADSARIIATKTPFCSKNPIRERSHAAGICIPQ
jgi:hypothetical protein